VAVSLVLTVVVLSDAGPSGVAPSAAVTVPLGVVRSVAVTVPSVVATAASVVVPSVAVTVASGTVSRDFGPGPDSADGRKIEI